MASPGTLTGRAVVYDTTTTIRTPYGSFDELVAPGALRDALRDPQITAVREHDPGQLLGRVSAGTLELIDSAAGLDFRLTLPQTEDGRTAAELVRRGDLNGVSFAFLIEQDRWHDPAKRGDRPTRVIVKVERLFDVSVVTWPAYGGTSVALAGSNGQRARQLDYYRRRALLAAARAGIPTRPRAGLPTRRRARLGAPCHPLPPVARWARQHRSTARIG